MAGRSMHPFLTHALLLLLSGAAASLMEGDYASEFEDELLDELDTELLDEFDDDRTINHEIDNMLRDMDQSTTPQKPLLAAEVDLTAKSCACLASSPCERRRELHPTGPQDPLQWCETSARCAIATVGDASHAEASRGRGVHWRHCGADRYFRWAAMPAPADVTAPHSLRIAQQRREPVRHRTVAPPPAATAPQRHYKVKMDPSSSTKQKPRHFSPKPPPPRHYIYQTDCPPDGFGANVDVAKLALAVALRLNMKLVWNQRSFVSENSPQYVGSNRELNFPLATTPGDVFHPTGFGRYAPAVRDGTTIETLLARIDSGALRLHVIDAPPAGGGTAIDGVVRALRRSSTGGGTYLGGGRRSRSSRAPIWPNGRERLVVLRFCVSIEEFLAPTQAWVHHAYGAARAALRPMLPSALARMPRTAFAVVAHLRYGDIGQASRYGALTSVWNWVPLATYGRMLNAVFGAPPHPGIVDCTTARAVVVTQAGPAGEAMLRKELAATKRCEAFEPCTEWAVARLGRDDAETSATAVFAALDTFANADVLLLGSQSAFAKVAAALAPSATVKIVPVPAPDRVQFALDWGGIESIIMACGGGEVNAAALHASWRERDDASRRSAAPRLGCVQ